MAVGQLPDHVGEFARYLRDLLARLDQGAGWCGVFWQRDPDGMRACLEGAEVPPWDVVQALLHDLAADRGIPEAERETGLARELHRASLTAYDARPGARQLLGERLDLMLQEQRYAVERQQELTSSLASAATADETDRLNLDLAWVRDDHERASARCDELRERIERLEERERDGERGGGWGGHPTFVVDAEHGGDDVKGWQDPPEADDTGSSVRERVPEPREPADDHPGPGPGPEPAPEARPRKRGRGGARFAGLGGFGGGRDAGPDPVSVPSEGAPQPAGACSPRGARFAHSDDDGGRSGGLPGSGTGSGTGPGPGQHPAPTDPHAPATEAQHLTSPDAVAEAVAALIRLRGEGRSGEAHGVLVEAAAWPAARLPLFAVELHRAGLGADWATLLWEAASLPPDRLVAVADALAGSGRAEDCRKLLRQGVARPASDIAEAVLALDDAGRGREARALLDAYVRVRAPEEVAACAHTDPYRLIPVLLETAQGVSDEHHWDLVHALRVAGFNT
ncbi:hypothetical protein [Streptomyces sp. NPDC059009]|uniref:hypothetical protein n=1 Tax=Streptomyces sp. NPDC059009 TaxID=3346694 RepID=UPI0036B0B653